MTDILTRGAPQSDAEIEAELTQIFAELETLNERMRRDQADIVRLKNETDAYKAESARLKEEAVSLKVTSDELGVQSRAALKRLKVMIEGQ